MMRWLLLMLPALGLSALSAAWLPHHTMLRWKLAILGLEFGHWFALGCFIAVALAWRWWRGTELVLVILCSVVWGLMLLLPAYLASKRTPNFSWSRLWLPWWHQVPSTKTSTHVYWAEAKLELIHYHAVGNGAPTPCVIILHTGGWDSGTHTEFASAHRELASHGIAVIAMRYRLAPQHPWPAQKEDVRRAVEFVRANAQTFGVDVEELFLMGRSAGGQIATACAYTMPELGLRGCIALYAPHDMLFARQYAFEDDILNSLKLLRQYLGGDPKDAEDNYRSASARLAAHPGVPPTLLMHGARDTMVWVKQSQLLATKLKHEGVAHRYVELPWATHACDHFPHTPGGQVVMQSLVNFIHQRG
jgi:acetyl esterase/lipase